MPLTDEQKAQIEETIQAINTEGNGIIEAREDVLAAVRIDETNPDDISPMTVIQAAKARAVVHANALAELLSP